MEKKSDFIKIGGTRFKLSDVKYYRVASFSDNKSRFYMNFGGSNTIEFIDETKVIEEYASTLDDLLMNKKEKITEEEDEEI